VSDESSPPAAVDDVFEQAMALFTPARLLADPRASGEGVRVALIDTGVERKVVEARCRVRGSEMYPLEGAVFLQSCAEPLPYEGRQSSPHGTTVADIILTLAPRVRLFSADVFGPAASSDIDTLLRALRHAMDVWNCKVINLSLGVTEERFQAIQQRRQLYSTIEEAYFRGIIVVAASHNDHPLVRSYPALFAPPLLSVNKSLFDDPLRLDYALDEHIEFLAHGRGYLGPFAHEPATSWAAPHLTAIVARLLTLRPTLKLFEVKTILYWLSQAKPGSVSG
jgi:subtilisin family serine protease